jgi:hypothetical protein
MGFGTDISDMVDLALTNAHGLFGDLIPFIALIVGVLVVGFIVKWFIDSRSS